ncbi:MAG: DUF721 domain-containing protein [Fimbriimonadales bacterium]|nr:DUF721 domain-containing protein [Fimbriimonadales bacterium]
MSRDPKRLQDVMSAALGRPELVKLVRAHRIWAHWSEVVGENLAKKCSPEKFESGTLFVTVSSASWAQELRMHKQELLEKLNRIENVFDDIRFTVGAVVQPSEVADSNEFGALEPESIDVTFEVSEIEEVGRRALGKMKALRRIQDVAED